MIHLAPRATLEYGFLDRPSVPLTWRWRCRASIILLLGYRSDFFYRSAYGRRQIINRELRLRFHFVITIER